MKKPKTLNQLLKENELLRIKLQEAEDTLQAIHEGAVDAIVVKGRKGEKIFTLSGEEQIYRRLVETMGEAGLTTTPEGKILFCNRQLSEMLGFPMEEIVGRDLEEFVKESDRKKMAVLLIKAQIEPTRKRLVFLASNGSLVPAWVSANLLEHEDTVSICLVAMDQTELEASKEAMRQISEQREQLQGQQEELQSQYEELQTQREELQMQNDELIRTEANLHKLNRTLRALSNSNQALLHAADERKFLKEVCKVIVKDCGHTMVWIGLAEDDEEKSVTPAAYSGFDKGYLETLKITWADTERGQGPTGTAIRTGEVAICKNMLTDPKFKPWRAEAIKRGYASSIVLPLMEGAKAFGSLSIYSKEPDPFSEDEVRLLTELANDLAFGITALRSRVAREKAEEQLFEVHQRLEAMMNATPVGISFSDDVTCKHITGNPAALAQFEVSSSDNLSASAPSKTDAGRQVQFFKGGRQISDKELPLQRAVAENKEIEPMELEVVLPSGKRWFAQASGAPIRDKKGNVIGGVAATVDITERKQAEEALRESQAQLALAADAAKIGIFDWHIRTGELYWTAQHERIFGLPTTTTTTTTTTHTYKDWSQRVHPEDLPRVEDGVQLAMDEGTFYEVEYRIIWPDGSIHWIAERALFHYDSARQATRMLGTVIDITYRKQAEEALKASEHRYRGLFENMINGFAHCQMLFDDNERPVDLTYLDVNSAFYRITGLENVVGKRFTEIFPNIREEYPELLETYGRVARSGNPEQFEIDFKPLAKLLSISVYSTQPDHFVAIFEDITERKRAEEKLKAITEELKRSNTDLQQFAYTASHDLREPLRAINGFVDLLQQRYKEKLDEKGLEYIEYAINGTRRMDALLTGLLQYSRVQTQGKSLTLTPGHAAFNAAVTNLRASITETHAIITSDPLPPVKADGTQLVQLFQNLIGNAVKFRGEERPEIHVGCDKKENCWQFYVRDNGIGIDPVFQERLFTIFYRVKASDERSGTGIGLAICKKIVERHGGKIWVESQAGKGTTFFFTIPV